MPDGLIIKALSGYYYVLPGGAADSGNHTVQCRARGIFKKDKITPLVGDRVVYELTENGEGTVTRIYPRQTELVRPPIANARVALLVFSVDKPALNLQLLDKFLVHVENAGLEPLICLTKNDLLQDPASGLTLQTAETERLYEAIGYPVYRTSARRHDGVAPIIERLQGTITVFAGQSGVGKSSLLNAMFPGLQMHTSEISTKLGRGRHTTRHVELIPHAGGWVADTPGFSQLDFLELEPEGLGHCFREFRQYASACKFRGCLHDAEPGCKVREAVEDGRIAPTRYEHYRSFLAEMKERKRRY